jgi:glutamate dehydrogenase (NAD(P)+)
MTVKRMGDWSMIVEGANTYSPDPQRRAARARMERVVYWQEGVVIASDFLVNSGGVIYAAQEHLIRTPDALRIPDELLGDVAAVEGWLHEHAGAFAELAEKRRLAAEAQIQRVIPRNMSELIDRLVADCDRLPLEAAEQIAVARIAASESDRTVADVMAPIATVSAGSTVRDAAQRLVAETGDLLAVVDDGGALVGVVTEWDVTRASATACAADLPLDEIMSRAVISACPQETILDVVRKLEYHEISAMPVVDDDNVVGLISSDILAQRTLYRLLQAQES